MSEVYRVIPNSGQGFILQGSDGAYYGGSFACDSKDFLQTATDHALAGGVESLVEQWETVKAVIDEYTPKQREYTADELADNYLIAVDVILKHRKPWLFKEPTPTYATPQRTKDLFRIVERRLAEDHERLWGTKMRMYFANDTDKKKVEYPSERLDKKQKNLERLLLAILLDYLIGALNRAETLRRGLSLIDQHFDALIAELSAFYRGKGLEGTPESEDLKGRKAKIRAEFERLIDTEEPYWKSREGLTQGALLLAVLATYSAAAVVAESVAQHEGLKLIWVTKGDEFVCKACEELEGTTYAPGDVTPPMPLHENCRCWWELVIKEGK